jgi:hypothetical protein
MIGTRHLCWNHDWLMCVSRHIELLDAIVVYWNENWYINSRCRGLMVL